MKTILPILVIGLGVLAFATLKQTKPEAEKSERIDQGTLVEIATVAMGDQKIWIDARGKVLPSRQVTLGAEVTGKVKQLAKGLDVGSHFNEGELLVRIDAGDYRLALEQQLAMVESAQTQLEIEQGRKIVAEKEWELFNPAQDGEQNSLATREPQIRSARTGLRSARSGLQQAKRTISKTLIRAPFRGVVRGKAVETDQIVGPGTPMLTYVGTDSFTVRVSVPIEKLGYIELPSVDGKKVGARAVVTQAMGDDEKIEREGHVTRVLSDVDPGGRMARLLVEIDDPMGLRNHSKDSAENANSSLPLLLGSFVEIAIEGKEIAGAVEVPRHALRDGRRVYLYKDGVLNIKEVTPIWKRQDTVLVKNGVKSGDKLIISSVTSAVEGMKLRLPATKKNEDAKHNHGVAGDNMSPTPQSKAVSHP